MTWTCRIFISKGITGESCTVYQEVIRSGDVDARLAPTAQHHRGQPARLRSAVTDHDTGKHWCRGVPGLGAGTDIAHNSRSLNHTPSSTSDWLEVYYNNSIIPGIEILCNTGFLCTNMAPSEFTLSLCTNVTHKAWLNHAPSSPSDWLELWLVVWAPGSKSNADQIN